MRTISVIVHNDGRQILQKDQRYVFDKIIEIKNHLGIDVNIKFI